MKIKNLIATGLLISGCSIASKNCYKTLDLKEINSIPQIEFKSDKARKLEEMFENYPDFFRKFPQSRFNSSESYENLNYKQLIKKINDPFQVQDYLERTIRFDESELNGKSINLGFMILNIGIKGYSFKYTAEMKKGTCLDYAVAAAALLSDNNYPPLILAMTGKNEKGHAVFLYKTKSGFGCLGNTPLAPVFPDIESLVKKLGNYEYYTIVNLDENFKNREWIDGNVDLAVTMFDKAYKIGLKNK